MATGELVFAFPDGGGLRTSPVTIFSENAFIESRINLGFRVNAEQQAEKPCGSPLRLPNSPRVLKVRSNLKSLTLT